MRAAAENSFARVLNQRLEDYEVIQFFRRGENEYRFRTPTCEPLKRLIYSPEIQSHIHKKEKELKKTDIQSVKQQFSKNEDELDARLE